MEESEAIITEERRCPYCGGTEVEWGNWNMRGTEAVQDYTCTTCGAEGGEVYAFQYCEWDKKGESNEQA